MFDLTIVAVGGLWLLEDDREGKLGAYASRAEALAAAGDFARVDDEPRIVLVQDQSGEWDETVVEPTAYH
ncbi:hypothetical protein [Phenylobacterium sp.]|uniref:hypothetical protein n=1 Tax=Phenylobacterium sp. TaxID=1871053 RepID=UPI00398334FB